MTMSLPAEIIEQQNRATAEQAVNIARAYKWPVPDRFTTVNARYVEAARLAHIPPPQMPELPDDASKLEKVLRGHATELATYRLLTEVAEQTASSAGRDMTVAVRSVLPSWVDALCAEFSEAVAVFLRNIHIASNRELTGYEDDEQVAALLAQKRVIALLDRMVDERVLLGTGIAEPDCHRGLLWMVVQPPQPTAENIEAGLADQLSAAAKEYNSRAFMDLAGYERWRHVASLGTLSLPRLGEVHARVDTFDRLRGQFGGGALMTPQGQAAHRDVQSRQRDDMLRNRAKVQAEREANMAEVHRQRQVAAGLL